MTYRILVVEDDKKIASFVVKGLKQGGFAVDHCGDGEEALILGETTTYDAAVVDIMLPKLDGLSFVQRLRAKKIRPARKHTRSPQVRCHDPQSDARGLDRVCLGDRERDDAE